MDAKRFLDHLSNDEGITDGVGDDEAKLLIKWLRAKVKAGVAKVRTEVEAWDLTRELAKRAKSLGKVVSLLCDDEDPPAAGKVWAELGHAEPLAGLPVADPKAVMAKLIAMEEAKRV